jgi:UDP-glucose 4-epimerase
VALNREVSSSIQAGNYAAAIPLAQRALRGRRAQIAAGADPEGEIGEDHNPETHLIPLVFDAALGRREAISVYGTDYPTPDGTAIRDYIHSHGLGRCTCASSSASPSRRREHVT